MNYEARSIGKEKKKMLAKKEKKKYAIPIPLKIKVKEPPPIYIRLLSYFYRGIKKYSRF